MAALHEFLWSNRGEILKICTQKIMDSSPQAAARKDELTDDLPDYLDEIIGALRRDSGLPSDSQLPEKSEVAVSHGRQRFRLGFNIAAVVHDYGAMCDAITETAMRQKQPIEVKEYQVLNQSLDAGIAQAVQHYDAVRASAREREHTSQLGFVVHELRNALSNAAMSFDLIKGGRVPVDGRTSEVVQRSHFRLRDLIGKLLLDVRLRAGQLERQQLRLGQLLEEVEAAAVLDAQARKIELSLQVDTRLQLEADHELLASAVSNLVQNAIKFTRIGGRVVLRGFAEEREVLIEVEDECGGLPEGKEEELFAPFVKKGEDRTGLGLGLAIVRDSVQLHGGVVRVRNIAGKGCVFAIALPNK